MAFDDLLFGWTGRMISAWEIYMLETVGLLIV